MGKLQRDRGEAYELEVCAAVDAAWGPPKGQQKTTRHLGQARDGGSDITRGRFIFECKRRRGLAFSAWHRQAEAACPPASIPVVIARADHGESYAILALSDFLNLVPEPFR